MQECGTIAEKGRRAKERRIRETDLYCLSSISPTLQKRQPLLLDSSIRDWVLFPILLVMILVGLVRHYITLLINSSPKPQQPEVVRQQRIILRGTTLRSHFALIPRRAFKSRLDWLTDVLDRGTYIKPEEPKNVSDS